MPGILPMKVIKVGTSAQSRIAQACDRCRSKKIRCDGVTPCCSQCKNVGFECKTSDKLSRRAFPRGYTESLEERVRALESEVRELKDLLDEKDEKIDMLSRIHSFSPQNRRPSAASTSPAREAAQPAAAPEQVETIKIQQAPFLMDNEHNTDPYFMGPSSGRAFVDAFKTKLHESGKSYTNFDTKAFFNASQCLSSHSEVMNMPRVPPRVVSDQLINVFFQEWAPLFPVLHRPTFLKVYADYSADPDALKNPHSVAQLYLVFGTAALAAQSNTDLLPSYEAQWQDALEIVVHHNSLATLQCLLLAQIYCIAKADYDRLLHYTGIAVNLSNRLGLHQTQKRFTLGALTRETRKKVFWSLYTLDCFAAAALGLPRLIKDADVETEEPADVDDENVTERGFQATLPGESTKLSSALALFRLARVLSKVLDTEYPASTSHEISVQQIGALSDDLDAWRDSLAPHLRLEFVQDKPSTNVISSRSPLLALAYYYIRSLIHRPLASSDIGAKASSSLVALADSSKHIIQIIQLLEERHMSFTMCFNKPELLVLAGFGLLYQGLGLKADGKLIRDNQRLLCSIVQLLKPASALTSVAFKRVACAVLTVDSFAKPTLHRTTSSENTARRMPAPDAPTKSPKNQLQLIASRFSFSGPRPTKKEGHHYSRRSTAPHVLVPGNLAMYSRNGNHASQTSLNSVASEPIPNRIKRSPSTTDASPPDILKVAPPNLDYLPLGPQSTTPNINNGKSTQPSNFGEWDHLLGYFENYDSNSPVNAHNGIPSYISPEPISFASPSHPISDWSSDGWTIPNDFGPSHATTARSVFSLSEESLTSGEDLSSCDLGQELSGYLLGNGDDFRLQDHDAGALQA